MTRDIRLTDDQIEAMLRRRSSEPYPGLTRDVVNATSDLWQVSRWGLHVPSNRAAALLAAALLGVLLIGGALAGGVIRDLLDPVPPPLRQGWMGPLRSDVATMPRTDVPGNFVDVWSLPDADDASVAGIDVTRIWTTGPRKWTLALRELPPPDTALDATKTIIGYGLVLDDGGDGVPDCLIGVNNDTPQPSEYRVWVTNLDSGATEEQIGPPYGFPIEFGHPDEYRDDLLHRPSDAVLVPERRHALRVGRQLRGGVRVDIDVR